MSRPRLSTRENLLEGYRTSLGIEAPADVQAALNG